MDEKLKKSFKQLYAKRAKTTKKIENENDNAITKIKLSIKKALIVEYIHEKRNIDCRCIIYYVFW